MHFKFCPECGERLGECAFGDDGFVPWCGSCKRPYFDLFPAVTVTLVANELGEVALLRQKYMSEKYLNFVSGYVRPGESMELCARREVLEEIGIPVTKLRFAASLWDEPQQLLLAGFIAEADKRDFSLSGEVNAARWIKAEDAFAMIYPEGNITHKLLLEYIRGRNGVSEQ